MTREYSIAHAKDHLAEAVRGDFWTALQEFRATFDSARDGVEPEYWESLRDRSPGRDVDFGS